MASGEAILFKEIWDALEPEERVSFVTGHPLPDQYEMRTFYFSHLLTKGAFPKFRLNKENIVFMTLSEHRTWENYKYLIRENKHKMKLWEHVFVKADKLKKEYYEKHN